MELEATTEGGQDKWGRRYGASGMYALLSTIHNRDAILSSNRIESRVKVLLQKNNLIKGNKLFAHVTLEKGERSELANLANDLL